MMSNFNKKICLFLFLLLPISAFAMFVHPALVPVDRLITNTNAFLKGNPNNHQALYMLARIHYLAFINKADSVGATSEGDPKKNAPTIAPDYLLGDFIANARLIQTEKLTLKELGVASLENQPEEIRNKYYAINQRISKELFEQNWEPEKINQEAILNHAKEAIINFNKAIKIDEKSGLYLLGLASINLQYLNYKKTLEVKNEPVELKEIDLEKTRTLFYKAYSLTIKEDLKLESKPIAGLKSLVSFEAGNAYVDITKSLPNKPAGDAKIVEEVTKNVANLNLIGQGKPIMMTPIIFTLEKHLTISELLNSQLNVNFDLDGDGKVELWPWLKNTTGLLVWDPQAMGKITSGRQLFGSVTWWIFFENGYQALDSLDDNRDGQLSGEELIGISSWFDKNSNGISEPGEMFSLNTLGIQSIGTKPTGEISGMPMHKTGITLLNGEKLPTYDWITSPSKSVSK